MSLRGENCFLNSCISDRITTAIITGGNRGTYWPCGLCLKFLGPPNHLRVESIIALGFPGESKSPVPADRLDYGKIHYTRYGGRRG